jgi:hypothetical protein
MLLLSPFAGQQEICKNWIGKWLPGDLPGGKLTTTQPVIVSQGRMAAIAGGAAAEGPVIEHLKSYSHPRVDRWARPRACFGPRYFGITTTSSFGIASSVLRSIPR